MSINYRAKYLKYKSKYLNLKEMLGGLGDKDVTEDFPSWEHLWEDHAQPFFSKEYEKIKAQMPDIDLNTAAGKAKANAKLLQAIGEKKYYEWVEMMKTKYPGDVPENNPVYHA